MDTSNEFEKSQLCQSENSPMYDIPCTIQVKDQPVKIQSKSKSINKKNLSSTFHPKKTNISPEFLERNKNSPYLRPLDSFRNSSPPPLLRSQAIPSLSQSIQPARIIPPSTSRSPRKYLRAGKEEIPYTTRLEWQQQSGAYHLKQINQKHQQERQYTRIYSADPLKQRQLSIQRVSSNRQMKEIEDRRQRYRECKDYQKSVRYEERHQRFYNDEIYSRTGKQYRYIPNHDRTNPNNNEYIYI